MVSKKSASVDVSGQSTFDSGSRRKGWSKTGISRHLATQLHYGTAIA